MSIICWQSVVKGGGNTDKNTDTNADINTDKNTDENTNTNTDTYTNLCRTVGLSVPFMSIICWQSVVKGGGKR